MREASNRGYEEKQRWVEEVLGRGDKIRDDTTSGNQEHDSS